MNHQNLPFQQRGRTDGNNRGKVGISALNILSSIKFKEYTKNLYKMYPLNCQRLKNDCCNLTQMITLLHLTKNTQLHVYLHQEMVIYVMEALAAMRKAKQLIS
jgi:hypothetical protein